jgi:hypothetical protein
MHEPLDYWSKQFSFLAFGDGFVMEFLFQELWTKN